MKSGLFFYPSHLKKKFYRFFEKYRLHFRTERARKLLKEIPDSDGKHRSSYCFPKSFVVVLQNLSWPNTSQCFHPRASLASKIKSRVGGGGGGGRKGDKDLF